MRSLFRLGHCVIEDQQSFVFTIGGDVVEKRPVTVGFSDGSRVEILDGLTASDEVIVDSRFAVHPGQNVRIAASGK